MSQVNMLDIEDFYIFGIPIQTEIGKAHFLKMRDYPTYFADLQVIGMSKLEILYKTNEMNKDGSLDDLIAEIEKLGLFELSMSWKELKDSYLNIFTKVFDDPYILDSITSQNFEYYRQLVMKMNGTKEEKINPNPEIQKALDRSKRVKSLGQEKLTVADMCSSIVTYTGISYEDILDYTIYQFFVTFQRIGTFINYDTTALFATVSPDIEMENWSKHIDLYEEEGHTISEEQFKKTTGDVIGG